MLVQGDNIVPDALFPLQPHRRPLYEWMGASLYEWQVVGLIVLAGVDLSPPDGAAMQMSTCPLCSLLAPARDGVPNFCSNWGFTMEAVLSKDHYQNTHHFCTFHTPQHGTIPH